jgi:gliding motility-associated lipoprotein GldD
MKKSLALLFLGTVFMLQSCGNESISSPKPRAYPRVIYPEKAYQPFDKDYCNFTFEYPAYAVVQKDTAFFEEAPTHPCWFDIFYPDFDSRIYFTYYPIGGGKSFEELKTDAFELVDWHNKKANYIDELRIQKDNGVSGFAFIIEGPAASPFQFYLTDSTRHFVRGSLYFNTRVQTDSLAPIYDFVEEDLLRIIETFEWQ